VLEKPKGHRGSFYNKFRAHIVARHHLAELFSQKLAFVPFDLANPIWVEASEIDFDWHIQTLTLAKPGSRVQLDAAIGKLHQGMLDRDRPLWQFTLIEGLASGEIAFYAKIHHAALDGQGGVALAQAILDVTPKPALVSAVGKLNTTKSSPLSVLSSTKMIAAALRNSAAQYKKILTSAPAALRAAASFGVSALSSSQAKKLGAPTEQLTGVAGMNTIAASANRLGKLKSADTPLQAAKKLLPKGMKLGPRTPLNVAVSGERTFKTARIPLVEVKAVAKHFDVKLNDVMLAICAGALRRYFASSPETVKKSMIAAVPVSLRNPASTGDMSGTGSTGDTVGNNQVSMMLIDLATNIADPVKRLHAIHSASMSAKKSAGIMKGVLSSAVSDLPTLGIPWLMSVITPLYKTAVASNRIPVIANVVVSNVQGSPVPLYLAGAKMHEYYPVSIVTHGLALNITIFSYAGNLDIGLIAAKKTVPKLDKIAKHMVAAHHELLAVMTSAIAVNKVTEHIATNLKTTTRKATNYIAKRQ